MEEAEVDMKKVSLILTTYNCKDHLDITLKSILEQDYPLIEVVIKDGGSTDGTLEVIQSYQERLTERLIWVSEKDNGIYDAMNHGYQLSTGDVVTFFNDVFAKPSAVSKLMQAIEDGGENCLGAHADLVYMNSNGKIIRTWRMGKGRFARGWMPGHPTLYLKRSVYEEKGLYRTDYKCSADYEFMIRALYGKEQRLAYVPEIFVKMFYGGTSTGSLKSYWISLREGHDALRENEISILTAYWIDLQRILRVLFQFKGRDEKNEDIDYCSSL